MEASPQGAETGVGAESEAGTDNWAGTATHAGVDELLPYLTPPTSLTQPRFSSTKRPTPRQLHPDAACLLDSFREALTEDKHAGDSLGRDGDLLSPKSSDSGGSSDSEHAALSPAPPHLLTPQMPHWQPTHVVPPARLAPTPDPAPPQGEHVLQKLAHAAASITT